MEKGKQVVALLLTVAMVFGVCDWAPLGLAVKEAAAELVWPSKLTKILEKAFRWDASVKGVLDIPEKVEEVGARAFQGTELHGVEIEGKPEIGRAAFQSESLVYVRLDDPDAELAKNAAGGARYIFAPSANTEAKEYADRQEGTTFIPLDKLAQDDTFYYATGGDKATVLVPVNPETAGTSVTIPETVSGFTVASAGEDAFLGLDKVKQVNVPAGFTIGKTAMENLAEDVKVVEEGKEEPIITGDFEIITFGNYPQGENGEIAPIEWYILAKDGNKMLLLSRYGLDTQKYNNTYTDVTWETCTLRTWLNGTFMNTAFSSAEKKAIQTTLVDNSDSQGYDDATTTGGNNTEDQVFLLSVKEVKAFFPEDDSNGHNAVRATSPTDYAVAQGADVWDSDSSILNDEEYDGNGSWWLRSPGKNSQHNGTAVYPFGQVGYTDGTVTVPNWIVRPAMWVDLNDIGDDEDDNDYEIVSFGNYPQGENGEIAPIQWIVLAKNGEKGLLLSRYGLDVMPYGDGESETATWETSWLRTWLNNMDGWGFLDMFTESEQDAIYETLVDNSQSQGIDSFSVTGGNNTNDKVFALSVQEVSTYLPTDESRITIPTEYAKAQGACPPEYNDDYCWWWLRSPGSNDRDSAVNVSPSGRITAFEELDRGDVTVRPAMWVDLTQVSSADTGISFTMSSTSALVGSEITFNITAPGASKVRLVVDGEDTACEAEVAMNGSATLYRRLTSMGTDGKRQIAFRALYDGVWSAPCTAQEITLTKTFDLTPPMLTGANTTYINSPYTVQWDAVENADGYSIYICYPDGTAQSEEEAFTIEVEGFCPDFFTFDEEQNRYTYVFSEMVFETAGTHTLRIMAWAEGAEQVSGTKDVEVISLFDIVKFGTYPQGYDGEIEPIEWFVLAKDGVKSLLLSRYSLDIQNYGLDHTGITWKASTLRTWLNDTFLNTAFKPSEQNAIQTTLVYNSEGNSGDTSTGENNTEDKVFLLSIQEAETYFPDDASRTTEPTVFTTQNFISRLSIEWYTSKRLCSWWLRTPGYDQTFASLVSPFGVIGGDNAIDAHLVRPALWVDFSAIGSGEQPAGLTILSPSADKELDSTDLSLTWTAVQGTEYYEVSVWETDASGKRTTCVTNTFTNDERYELQLEYGKRYQATVTAYGDGEEESDSVVFSVIGEVKPTFTMSPNPVVVGNEVTFKISAPGAEKVQLVVDGIGYEDITLTDGHAEYLRVIHMAGEDNKRAVAFSPFVGGVWLSPCDAQILGTVTSSVSGRIVTAEGITIPEVSIEIFNQNGECVDRLKSDEKGRWTTSVLENGNTYRVICSHPQFSFIETDFTITSQVTEIPDIVGNSETGYLLTDPVILRMENGAVESTIQLGTTASWTMICGQEWIHVDQQSGEGSGIVAVEVEQNPNDYARVGSITFTGAGTMTIPVVQYGKISKRIPDPLIVDPQTDNEMREYGDITVKWRAVADADHYVISLRDFETDTLLLNHEALYDFDEDENEDVCSTVLHPDKFWPGRDYRVAVAAVPKYLQSTDSAVSWSERRFSIPEAIVAKTSNITGSVYYLPYDEEDESEEPAQNVAVLLYLVTMEDREYLTMTRTQQDGTFLFENCMVGSTYLVDVVSDDSQITEAALSSRGGMVQDTIRTAMQKEFAISSRNGDETTYSADASADVKVTSNGGNLGIMYITPLMSSDIQEKWRAEIAQRPHGVWSEYFDGKNQSDQAKYWETGFSRYDYNGKTWKWDHEANRYTPNINFKFASSATKKSMIDFSSTKYQRIKLFYFDRPNTPRNDVTEVRYLNSSQEFSALYNGYIQVPDAGKYSFRVRTDNGDAALKFIKSEVKNGKSQLHTDEKWWFFDLREKEYTLEENEILMFELVYRHEKASKDGGIIFEYCKVQDGEERKYRVVPEGWLYQGDRKYHVSNDWMKSGETVQSLHDEVKEAFTNATNDITKSLASDVFSEYILSGYKEAWEETLANIDHSDFGDVFLERVLKPAADDVLDDMFEEFVLDPALGIEGKTWQEKYDAIVESIQEIPENLVKPQNVIEATFTIMDILIRSSDENKRKRYTEYYSRCFGYQWANNEVIFKSIPDGPAEYEYSLSVAYKEGNKAYKSATSINDFLSTQWNNFKSFCTVDHLCSCIHLTMLERRDYYEMLKRQGSEFTKVNEEMKSTAFGKFCDYVLSTSYNASQAADPNSTGSISPLNNNTGHRYYVEAINNVNMTIQDLFMNASREFNDGMSLAEVAYRKLAIDVIRLYGNEYKQFLKGL